MLLTSLPRRQRLLCLVISFTLCLCAVGLVHQIFRSGSDNGLVEFKDENNDCARFDVRSPYRQNPDRGLERRIDDALLAIQHANEQKSQPDVPVMKIWQTWRDNTVPANFDQPTLWRELHRDWEHNVCAQYGLTVKY
jgi:mannosyltransferase OCH1-like enzyme